MTPLFGHEEAVAALRAGLDSGRLHHAWLLAGPRGIGKALFAHKAALRVLAQATGPLPVPALDVPDHHPAARLTAAGSHPDLAVLERLPKDNGADLARSINVDQVRGLSRLFATTASMSPWRVVIVDAADDLEPSGANALLKRLEEPPPHSLFLLVSHAPERLLPTIRSRCRLLRLKPLDDGDMAAALRHALPEASEAEIGKLVQVGEGAPGRAVAYQGLQIEELDAAMRALARTGDRTGEQRSQLAAGLSLKAAQPRYEAFLARAPSFIAAQARDRRGAALADAVGLWEQATRLAALATRQSLDPQATAFEMAGLIARLEQSSPR